MDTIELIDENGELKKFKIIDTFGVDDYDYAALSPYDDERIMILQIINENGEINFKSIDDQNELNEIIEVYEQMKRG
ncbi:MAG: DUF1292 domain-containing protein [Tissierellia bacterium]|nr:DUF1292 domain-containing protein [Tissierellia bacterium]